MSTEGAPTAVSFDLFGTLVAVDRPDDPSRAVASALEDRGVTVPDGWQDAYATAHQSLPAGREYSLRTHVEEALAACGAEGSDREVVGGALHAAFEGPVRLRPGARAAVEAASARGPVGILSNCSVPGLVERVLQRVSLPTVDAVVVSVDCGWRKPHPKAFEAIADGLAVPPDRLCHVGDDPETDGGVTEVGGTFVSIHDRSLTELAALPEGERWA